MQWKIKESITPNIKRNGLKGKKVGVLNDFIKKKTSSLEQLYAYNQTVNEKMTEFISSLYIEESFQNYLNIRMRKNDKKELKLGIWILITLMTILLIYLLTLLFPRKKKAY